MLERVLLYKVFEKDILSIRRENDDSEEKYKKIKELDYKINYLYKFLHFLTKITYNTYRGKRKSVVTQYRQLIKAYFDDVDGMVIEECLTHFNYYFNGFTIRPFSKIKLALKMNYIGLLYSNEQFVKSGIFSEKFCRIYIQQYVLETIDHRKSQLLTNFYQITSYFYGRRYDEEDMVMKTNTKKIEDDEIEDLNDTTNKKSISQISNFFVESIDDSADTKLNLMLWIKPLKRQNTQMTEKTTTVDITKKEEGRRNPDKYKKQPIPVPLRRIVWNNWIGEDIGKAKCMCCKLTDITQLTFHCGHILAESKGGELIKDNLKPICQSCNSSMGNKNMDEFIQKYRF
jgi:5-methylcytosine-specific restriction endonuclease McrA